MKNHGLKFNVFINGDIGQFSNFFDAFVVFYEKVKELVGRGGCPVQLLDSFTWIELEDEKGNKSPIMFPEVRELAYFCGILDEGKIVPLPEDEKGQQEYLEKLSAGLRRTGFKVSKAIEQEIEERLEMSKNLQEKDKEKIAELTCMKINFMADVGENILNMADQIAE